MTMSIYDIGDLVRLTSTFAVSGTATDPTTVTLSIKPPSGTVTSYTYAAAEIVKNAVGVYYKDVPVTEYGEYSYRWIGTGAVATVEEGSFFVKEQKVTASSTTPVYTTLSEVKSVMPDTSFDSTYDVVLTMLLERASRSIDRLLNREPGAFAVATDTTRYFDGSGNSILWINEMAAAPTSISVAESGDLNTYTTWSSSDYYLWPYNALMEGIPYLRIDIDRLYGSKTYWPKYPKSVKIVGLFGYSTDAPSDVKQAVIIQTVRWFKRGQQAFRDVGGIIELGQLTYAQAIDPDISVVIEHLRVPTI